MGEQTNSNKYKVGSTIYAKINPQLKLSIEKYYQRIYYCRAMSAPRSKQFAYFERELISPNNTE